MQPVPSGGAGLSAWLCGQPRWPLCGREDNLRVGESELSRARGREPPVPFGFGCRGAGLFVSVGCVSGTRVAGVRACLCVNRADGVWRPCEGVHVIVCAVGEGRMCRVLMCVEGVGEECGRVWVCECICDGLCACDVWRPWERWVCV